MEKTYPKLDPEFKAKWTAALRSGEYQQGDSYLNWDDKFCCLGVLCAVNGVPTVKTDDEDGDSPQEFIPRSAIKAIPEFLIDDSELPTILANMNDGHSISGVKKHSFPEIADWIDANL